MTQTSTTLALAGISFMLTVIWGPPLLRILRHYKVGKAIRIEGPDRHFSKLGTPTMGGILIVIPVVFFTGLLNAASLIGISFTGRSIMLPLAVMVAFAVLGAIDDWEGLRGRPNAIGMSARKKLLVQILIAAVAAIGIIYILRTSIFYIPGMKGFIDLGIFYVPLMIFIIVATSNAVNLTDGLDGLAGLISATAFAAYGGIALLQEQVFLAQFCFIVVGAIFGFLWFNVHPALLFMGDTGSLALGATLAVVSLMTGHWFVLPIIAIIPASIVMSVILQVVYFRITGGRRLFKMAPLHHHFELSGWSETQVVQRFWLVGLLFAMIGVALALV